MPEREELIFEVVAKLRDEASQGARQVEAALARIQGSQATLAGASNRAGVELERFDRSLVSAASSARRLAIPLAAELAPAMDTTVARLAGAVTGAAALSTGLGALGLAAAGVAGVLAGRLVQAWRESTNAAEEFNRVLASMDVGAITGKVRELSGSLDELTRKAGQLRQTEDALKALGLAAPPTFPWDTSASEQNLAQRIKAAEDRSRGWRAIETAREVEAWAAFPAHQKLQQERAEGLVRDFTRESLAAEHGAFWERRIKRLEGESEIPLTLLVEPSAARSAELTREREAQRARLNLRTGEEAITFDLAQPERIRAEEHATNLARDRVAIERERLAIAAQLGPVVTEADAAAARFAAIELDRRRALIGVYDETEQAVINVRAQLEKQVLVHEELRRTDPAIGMLAGAKQLVVEWTSMGKVMENLTLDIGQNVAATLGRTLRGETKNVARDFADSLFRSLTDTAAQYAVGSAFKALLGGAGLSPLAVSAGGAVDVTGASAATLAGLTQQGLMLVQGTGGRTFAVPSGAMTRSQQAGALLRQQEMMPGDPQYAGVESQPYMFGYGDYGAIGAGAALSSGSFWNTPMYATQGPSGGYIAGATYGQAATYGLTAAGAGLAAYGIYQGSASGYRTSYTEAAIYGGVSGALAGAAVGATFGTLIGPGWGTVIGAVVGLGLGLAGANISQGKYKKMHARAQRNRDAATIGNGIQGALSEAETVALPDLLARRLPSGNTVGGVLLGIARHMGESELIDFLLDYGASTEGFNYERLNSYGELIAYLQPDGVRSLLDFALDVFRREFDRERNVLIGQEQVITRAGTRATVQTITPLSARSNLTPGRDTFFLQQPGQSDADLERFLFRLTELDNDRDLRVFRRDEDGLVFSRTMRS